MSNKMMYFVLLLTIGTVLQGSMASPTPDEERYLDKVINPEMLSWLTAVNYPQRYANPCKYYYGNLLSGAMPKRNSELINSLLSLPKNMNEAGK